MTLDDIPANEKQVMTRLLARLFRAAGCEPTCHCCAKRIGERQKFQLASIDGKDEMLCARCTPQKLEEKRESHRRLDEDIKKMQDHVRMNPREYPPYRQSFGGYSRPTRQRRKDES